MPSPHFQPPESERERHRSSSRSRSRSGRRRSRRSSRRHRRSHHKVSERNFAAAACSMLAVVGTCTALARSECFTFHGGDCHNQNAEYINAMGISSFFFGGHFLNTTTYYYKAFGYQYYMFNCVDTVTVAVMKSILSLCVISTICTLVAFVFDLVGPKQKHMMLVRRNGVLNITSVCLMLIVIGFCHWATQLLYVNLHTHKRAVGSKVDVYFGVSYYIIVGSTAANIAATAFNLLRRYPPREIDADHQTQPILSDVDMLMSDDSMIPPSVMVREPPPYTP